MSTGEEAEKGEGEVRVCPGAAIMGTKMEVLIQRFM
jgi:hypothetical protein